MFGIATSAGRLAKPDLMNNVLLVAERGSDPKQKSRAPLPPDRVPCSQDRHYLGIAFVM
jgi:hypothetical protein